MEVIEVSLWDILVSLSPHKLEKVWAIKALALGGQIWIEAEVSLVVPGNVPREALYDADFFPCQLIGIDASTLLLPQKYRVSVAFKADSAICDVILHAASDVGVLLLL